MVLMIMVTIVSIVIVLLLVNICYSSILQRALREALISKERVREWGLGVETKKANGKYTVEVVL